MSESELIKSKERVKAHGEVFTPQWIVDKMLDQDEIKPLTETLTATFLEPSAGEGVFLIEILRRKLSVAKEVSQTITDYEENSLIALASIYGIELLEDNVEMIVMNLFGEFYRFYSDEVQKYRVKSNDNVLKSARVIISANIVQGNTLTKLTTAGEPIVFSEWKLLPRKYGVRKVQRTEYSLEAIMNDGESQSATQHGEEQLDLFSFEESDVEKQDSEESEPKYVYEPVKFIDVWQRKMVEVGNNNIDLRHK